jgi:polyisoprenoid-binding protein YceI
MPAATVLPLGSANAQVTFAVRWFGVLTVRGWFTDITGSLRANGTEVDVDLEVAAASARTGIALRDRHLRGPRFLDAARFPAISFRGTGAWWDQARSVATGTITLRGISRPLVVSCAAAPHSSEATPDATLAGDFTVSRHDHGVGVAGGLARFNPLLRAIGARVSIRVVLVVPLSLLRPAPVLARGR